MDNNQLIIASLFQSMKQEAELSEDLVRHLILNTYRMYRTKFKSKYGEIVICSDGGSTWRKEIFPLYKANRKKSQEKSSVDWTKMHDIMNVIRGEMQENFPYRNVQIRGIEADDIIATLAKHYHTQEKIMIVSNDKDFQQLQKYPNVEQYSPLKKRLLSCSNPEQFIVEHIIKGDTSDGIPNILSDDDSFVDENKRQKPCGEKRIAQIKEELDAWCDTDNWKRNKSLIDFSSIPEDVESVILDEYRKEPKGNRGKILNYFIDKKLKLLTNHIEEF